MLYLANALRLGERILLLTYNARLKQETRDRVKILGLGNLEVHSYHSLGVKVSKLFFLNFTSTPSIH